MVLTFLVTLRIVAMAIHIIVTKILLFIKSKNINKGHIYFSKVCYYIPMNLLLVLPLMVSLGEYSLYSCIDKYLVILEKG